MNKYETYFNKILSTRNEEQLQAIRSTEGPVMVIAGPGSGKTDVLSLRIGYILSRSDIQAYNILCLTYTDAGVTAMKRRLLRYIGPSAYQAHIFTFHSFCNKIIQENIEHFGGYRELQRRSDLEHIDIMTTLIDALPVGHIFKKLRGDIYYHKQGLENLFDLMKRENWSPDFLISHIDRFLDEEKLHDRFYYKRNGKGYKKGDFKQNDWDKFEKKYNKTKAAAKLLHRYNELLLDLKRYDYTDMILWVLKAFQKDPDLLRDYQEQYQYILVDEFQDTNGAQLHLVNLLADYWEKPNLFVVGDDDQAIYKFQGANKQNIEAFRKKYAPKEIVLNKNYRSSQSILDPATQLIQYNTDRIADKILLAAGPNADFDQPVKIKAYPHIDQQEADLVAQLVRLYQDGHVKDRHSVAVIYKKHVHAQRIIKILESLEIPIELRKKIDILHTPLIRQILLIFKYLEAQMRDPDQNDDILFEIMTFQFFALEIRDILDIQKEYLRRKRKKSLYAILGDEEWMKGQELINPDALSDFKNMLDDWLAQYRRYTLQGYFEYILQSGNILDTILHAPHRAWSLQLVNTLMDYIKTESVKTPDMQLKDLLYQIEQMQQYNISIPTNKSLQTRAGIQFMTAHGAKGLEMEYVFIINATNKVWDNPKGQNNRDLAIPPSLVGIQDQHSIEDDRRLFYVAMTRAKKYLTISYALSDGDKEFLPSEFVQQITDNPSVQTENVLCDEELVLDFLHRNLIPAALKEDWIDKTRIKELIDNYVMNVTGLSKYLRCPVSFYFENLLRVPAARNASMGFGNAIHYALEVFFRFKKFDQPKILLEAFAKGMHLYRSHFTEREYNDLLIFGNQELEAYYQNYHTQWHKDKRYVTELDLKNIQHRGVPISGKIDLIELIDHQAYVLDYKTGRYDPKKLKAPQSDDDYGADYWRQIMFYKILLDEDSYHNYNMQKGAMDFIQRDNYGSHQRKELALTPEHLRIVSDQITEVYARIKNYEFEQGCDDPKCKWCSMKNQTT